MQFEWDEVKSEVCFRQRGFDFAYAARAFSIQIAWYTLTPGVFMAKTGINCWAR